ncbi:hypothetical protein J0J24_24070, partial [Vibrio vulnificus]|uniref:hypothetical protein n=1 Tax=Vibrio vulnificus TaxID=672 RepID=UPI0019D44A8D
LVLNLISLDDKVNCNHSDCSDNQEEPELKDFNDFFSQEEEQMQEDTEDDEEEEEEEEEKEIAETLMTPLSTACSVPKSNKLKLMKEEEGSG